MSTIYTSQLDYWLHKINTYLTECHSKFRISQLDAIIEEHDMLQWRKGQERRAGFIYDGLIWRKSVKPAVWFEHLVPLEDSLRTKIDELIQSEHQAQKDFLRIRQGMLLVLRLCTNNQDLRDVLPEALIPAFGAELSTLPRTREPGFVIESELLRKQWENVLDRVNYHCAMRLIY